VASLAPVTEEIRFITRDECTEFLTTLRHGFGLDPPSDDPEARIARLLGVMPLETMIAAFDRGRIVATLAAFDLELTVPGGVAPMAGTTMVTVQPTAAAAFSLG
jgi:hypothetical protein